MVFFDQVPAMHESQERPMELVRVVIGRTLSDILCNDLLPGLGNRIHVPFADAP